MHLCSIADNLVAIDEAFFEKNLVLYALRGIDFSYNSFVSSMTLLMRKDIITLEDFQSQLMP